MTDALPRLLSIMAQLRDPQSGCPWDVEQTFSSIVPHTLEEAYEVAQAIADNDMTALQEELGDLLLQVVFHAQMAKEAGHFSFDEVAQTIGDKLVARHPHVFGEVEIVSAEAQEAAWEQMKAQERAAKDEKSESILDGITPGLTALQKAVKLTKKAAKTGFDWPDSHSIFDKLAEETQELQEAMTNDEPSARLREELGDMLFVLTNLARHLKIDPEQALAESNHKFDKRFRQMEAIAAECGQKMSEQPLDALDELWEIAKRQVKMRPE